MKGQDKALILVVDDQRDLCDLIRHILEMDGYRVLMAHDGLIGWRLVREELPDLVITDIEMPKVDGLQLCRKLRSNRRTADIPLLVLTILDKLSDKYSAYKIGADDYLTKPFVAAELKARVAARLRNASPRARGARRGLVLDRKAGECRVPGLEHPVSLTAEETEVLSHLLAQPYQPIPARTLCALAMDEPNAGAAELQGLARIISALRGKIEPDPNRPQYLFVLPTASYLLSPLGKGLPDFSRSG